jgi:hypothetical protein
VRLSTLNQAITDVIAGPAKRQELALSLDGKINYALRRKRTWRWPRCRNGPQIRRRSAQDRSEARR